MCDDGLIGKLRPSPTLLGGALLVVVGALLFAAQAVSLPPGGTELGLGTVLGLTGLGVLVAVLLRRLHRWWAAAGGALVLAGAVAVGDVLRPGQEVPYRAGAAFLGVTGLVLLALAVRSP